MAFAALGGLAGAAIGSFVAVLVLRWPAGRSLGGRSACDGCGVTLRAVELVPLLSALVLRGRCRRCGGAIDPLHTGAELAGAAIGAVSLAAAPGWAGLGGALFGWTLLALALLDLRHFWLPDRLTLPLLLAGLLLGLVPLAAPPFSERLIGGIAGFLSLSLVALAYLRMRGRVGLGQGDAKLFAALGAWLGWRALPPVLLAACGLGLIAVLALSLSGRRVAATTRLPFGAPLACAGWATWLWQVAG